MSKQPIKTETADQILIVRVTMKEKVSYAKAAGNTPVSQWVRTTLNNEAAK